MEITGPSVEAGEAYGVDNRLLYIIKEKSRRRRRQRDLGTWHYQQSHR